MEVNRKIIFCVMDCVIIEAYFFFYKRARMFPKPHYPPVVCNNLYFVKS